MLRAPGKLARCFVLFRVNFSQHLHTSSRPSRPTSILRRPRNAAAPELYVHTKLRAAIVGRPNVGKSTLFNRLASAVRNRAHDTIANPAPLVFVRSVVHSTPGVTRDPRPASAALSDLLMNIIDTPGLEDAVTSLPNQPHPENVACSQPSLADVGAMCPTPVYRALYQRMEQATEQAVKDANVVFFVIDAGEGLTEADRSVAQWLRAATADKDVILVANKCDIAGADSKGLEAYELGFGHPVFVSAQHSLGFADLYSHVNAIHLRLNEESQTDTTAHNPAVSEVAEEDLSPEEKVEMDFRSSFDDELVLTYAQRKGEEPLHQLIVSIIGRPNVGKSTLLNRLVSSDQSLVGPVAGVTRDAVLCEWKPPPGVSTTDDIPVWLVDTAGVRGQTKLESASLEQLCVRSSLRALRHSHVVVVVLDADDPLCHQDMKLLDVAVTEGRAVVIVVNKMDKISRDSLEDWRMSFQYKVDHKVSDLAGVEVLEMSAKEWKNGHVQSRRLYNAVQKARERWEKRVPTSALNRFVTQFNERMSVGGKIQGERRNRIGVTKFITQKKIRPPMFRLDGSSAVSLNYLKSLTNAIRKEFGFEGVPIRVKRPSRRNRK